MSGCCSFECTSPACVTGAFRTFGEFLDDHPCSTCGGHFNDHARLTSADIEYAREKDSLIVDICEDASPIPRGNTYWCHLMEAPESPCDSDFMEEIST